MRFLPSGTSATHSVRSLISQSRCSGYVALAVVGENDTLAMDLNTGLGGDRSGNMVAFAVEALKLVAEFIQKSASQSGKI